MELETELKLSYYRTIGTVDARHGVSLVQHTETGRVYVMKTQKIYDLRVYRYLLEHPVEGIPRIEELIESDGTLYVVEEYVPGETLRERMDRNGPMDEEQAKNLMRQLCRILIPLHRLEPPIVHRDIKPGNLIVRDDGKLVLVDFNTAKESHAEQERDTVLIGTAGYAAPEQYGFSASRPTADVYAMGVLYHELLTGKLPGREPYPGRTGEIIGKCLCMEPGRRYRTAEQLLEALPGGKTPDKAKKRRKRSEQSGDWKSWLPPGFRTGRLSHMIPMALWYYCFGWVSFNMELEGCSSSEPCVIAARILVFLILLSVTLWCGNYRSVWSCLPLSGSPKRLPRLAGVVLGACAVFCSTFFLSCFLMAILFP